VSQPLKEGQVLHLRDKRRTLPVRIVSQLRPDRTARMPWPLK
jgi:hypothetical protein